MPLLKYKPFVYSLVICLSMFSCKQEEKHSYMFDSLSSDSTNITFNNTLEKREMFNILYYLYYYNGGGVATGDINNDGLPDIYFTANSRVHNKLYLNKGNFVFEDITEKAGVAGSADWCTGVTMADINGDGYLDIYVCASSQHHGLQGRNELFINNKNGTFTESAQKFGLDFSGFGTQAAFFDYDHDGDLDCYLLNHSQKPHFTILDTSVRRKFDPISGDRLYRNDSAIKFTDVSAQAGIYQSAVGYGLGIAVADINNDGWDDIYVGNDFHENDYYYVNNGNGTFTESGAQHFKHYSRFSMGNDVADYDNDGQMDIVTVDMLPPDEKILKTYGSDENPDTYKFKIESHGYQQQYSKNCLQHNNGSGSSFSETALMSGVSATDWSWAPLFADFDNDGKKDLFVSSGIVKRPVDLDYIKFVSDLVLKSGSDLSKTSQYDEEALKAMPDGASHPYFFKGSGGFDFKDVSNSWGTAQMKGYYNGAAYCDLDNDGDLDVVMNCLNAPATVLKNNAPAKYAVDIICKGDGFNTKGIGAKVWLFAGGKMQYQQLMPTRGFQSASDTRLHFGMDSLHIIDSILVAWPNQKCQILKAIPAVPKIELTQSSAGLPFDYKAFFPTPKPLFEDITKQVNSGWQHRENGFVDFNQQYLIPHEESTRGPKLAVADVNGDGLDDFYTCGARQQPGTLMIQQPNGTFKPTDEASFLPDAGGEDVDAVFFDANGDKYPDLWVVSGGNELTENSQEMADRLYINDGKGHFTKSLYAFAPNYANKSCIATADIDKDGDVDVFVGGLCLPGKYGLPVPSFLYVNDGKGYFELDRNNRIKLDSVGMVTSACFTDIDKDGWPDLAITGEWMPLKVFGNKNGKFIGTDMASSTGLWQNMYIADVNGDGFDDILAGNWGHNTKLYAGKNGPLKLYVKDFDGNGRLEQVMAYTIDGKEYTFLAKDELERALPVMKKAYLKYGEVAGETVQYMFYDLFKNYLELKAEVLGSSVFTNDKKGGFTRQDLPEALQLAPLMAFAKTSQQNSFIGAGNFYGVTPYEGRYDAQLPTVFAVNGTAANLRTLPNIDGEIRDMKWLKTKAGNILALARNNKGIIFLKPNE